MHTSHPDVTVSTPLSFTLVPRILNPTLTGASTTACGDVVKKPKLDQHHGRCHAGFDCIDCSVTFNTPSEYKSHTLCISEAEKYQKSLYKGPKIVRAPPSGIAFRPMSNVDY